MKNAPSPPALPLINHFHYFLGDRLHNILQLQKNFGDIVHLKLGPLSTHLLMHPDHARHVLIENAKNYHKGRTFKKTEIYFGQGVATSDGDLWRTQRRLMNPHFKPESLACFIKTKTEVITKALDRFETAAQEKKIVDLSREFPRIAMEVVAKTLFGQSVDEKRINGIIDQVDHILKYTMNTIILPFTIPRWLPLFGTLKFNRSLQKINETIFLFIERERQNKEPSESLLSVLAHAEDLETKHKMSNQQIRDEAMTLFLGGIDTTGNTLPWVMLMLMKNPDVYARVQEEIAHVLGGSLPDASSLRKLEYLHATILETLRLYPQNYVMARDSLEDDEIGGFLIKKNTSLFISMYAIHRHQDFWEDPLHFNPARFFPEAMKNRHQNAYNPFGAGQRKCLGSNFALIEITLVLAMLLQRFSIKLLNQDKITPDPRWSLPIKGGMFCELTPHG